MDPVKNAQINEATFQASLMRQRRRILSEGREERWNAISDFVLSVAQSADDLRKVTQMRRDGVLPAQAVEAAGYIEDLIRQRYRECFGTELGQ